MDLRKSLLWAGIGALGVSTLYAVLLFLFGQFNAFQVKVLATILTAGVYSLTSFCSTGFKEKGLGNLEFLTVITILVSVAGAFLALDIIWLDHFKYNPVNETKAEFIMLILSFALAHISLLLKSFSDHRAVKALIICTAVFVGAVALMLINWILQDFEIQAEIYARLMISLAVLGLGGSIALPLVKKVTFS